MAGNILYIPYTILLVLALIILVVVIKLKNGNRASKHFLLISLPILLFFLFYFWNLDFNNYVKSYVFPSKVFECEYEQELKNSVIPLPKRTVFKGKQEVCSPFYSTYVNVRDFKSFYQEELEKLKTKGKIQTYHDIENKDQYWTENEGFVVELSSGSKIEILIRRRDGAGLISIHYRPQR